MWVNSRLLPKGFLWRDASGAVAVEFGLVGGIFITLLVAMLEFGHAFWQWNSATKAVQLGARLAAVSSPVSSDLKSLSGLSGSVQPGDPMPYFERVCSGATKSCSSGSYDAAAMNTIVFGPGNSACPTTAQKAMCRIFPRIKPENVVVEYVHTGLGFAGRPGGPVPTVTVRLTGLNFDFVVLGGLLGLGPVQMPGLATTVTGEDLSSQVQ